MGSHEIFCWGWLQTTIVLISTSQGDRVKGMSPCTWSKKNTLSQLSSGFLKFQVSQVSLNSKEIIQKTKATFYTKHTCEFGLTILFNNVNLALKTLFTYVIQCQTCIVQM
jgi:hypothetical protein